MFHFVFVFSRVLAFISSRLAPGDQSVCRLVLVRLCGGKRDESRVRVRRGQESWLPEFHLSPSKTAVRTLKKWRIVYGELRSKENVPAENA